MRNYFLAISTAFAAIYSPSIFAASGCVVIDGKTYELNLASMPIDPDVDVGTVLYTARVDTSGPKLTCPLNTARGKYSSQMLGSFQTLVGTNAYGNIYASGIDGIGIQIRDLEQSAKAVPYETVWILVHSTTGAQIKRHKSSLSKQEKLELAQVTLA